MADFLDEVAQYLDDQGVGNFDTASGRNIFVGDIPAGPDTLISLIGVTGSTPPIPSRQVPSLEFPRFQAFIRGVDYATASTKLQLVRTTLHAKYGVILPNWRVLSCHADQEGGPIGKDEIGRFEFTINFTCEVNAQTAP